MDMMRVKSADAGKEIATDRAELSGHHHTGTVQDWDYARLHSQAR